MFGTCAAILGRVDGIGAECGSGVPTPARVVEKPARQRDEICLAAGNDCFRLARVDDHADRLHHHAAGLLDGGGEGHLIARTDGRPRRRTDAAGGDADVVEADVAQLSGKIPALPGLIPPSTQSAPVMRMPMPSALWRGQTSRIAAATSSG